MVARDWAARDHYCPAFPIALLIDRAQHSIRCRTMSANAPREGVLENGCFTQHLVVPGPLPPLHVVVSADRAVMPNDNPKV